MQENTQARQNKSSIVSGVIYVAADHSDSCSYGLVSSASLWKTSHPLLISVILLDAVHSFQFTRNNFKAKRTQIIKPIILFQHVTNIRGRKPVKGCKDAKVKMKLRPPSNKLQYSIKAEIWLF